MSKGAPSKGVTRLCLSTIPGLLGRHPPPNKPVESHAGCTQRGEASRASAQSAVLVAGGACRWRGGGSPEPGGGGGGGGGGGSGSVRPVELQSGGALGDPGCSRARASGGWSSELLQPTRGGGAIHMGPDGVLIQVPRLGMWGILGPPKGMPVTPRHLSLGMALDCQGSLTPCWIVHGVQRVCSALALYIPGAFSTGLL